MHAFDERCLIFSDSCKEATYGFRTQTSMVVVRCRRIFPGRPASMATQTVGIISTRICSLESHPTRTVQAAWAPIATTNKSHTACRKSSHSCSCRVQTAAYPNSCHCPMRWTKAMWRLSCNAREYRPCCLTTLPSRTHTCIGWRFQTRRPSSIYRRPIIY